jgi:hypothetical protein
MTELVRRLRFGSSVTEAERIEIAGWLDLDESTDYRSRSPFRSGAWFVEILLAVPLGMIGGATGEAGKEVFLALKRLWKAEPRRRQGSIVAVGSDGTRLTAVPPLPDEAIDALRSLDWSSVVGEDLEWDPNRRRWVDLRSPE